jgi:hypothetical protein
MLLKIALSILFIWFMAGVIPLVIQTQKTRLWAFAALAVFSVAIFGSWIMGDWPLNVVFNVANAGLAAFAN